LSRPGPRWWQPAGGPDSSRLHRAGEGEVHLAVLVRPDVLLGEGMRHPQRPADAIAQAVRLADGGMDGKPQFDPLIEVGVIADPARVAVKPHRQLRQRAGLRLGHPAVRAHEFPAQLEKSGRGGVQEQPEHF